ncbi:hypothetical protein [Lacicoccus qingdaonensis]|uniref:Uncharacterized protein n=1 Tax=Lacicoccus qingdaonensis TaxID=576118 RepID=A0A1G9G699_9BACL|nr:hypothetical protein [Salinicoccus qingdaonensis]SDK96125.1 hypothetical protein SAMN05216216_11554 [Salinicoccus qingdaonensis]
MAQKSKFKDPGLILTVVVFIYSVFVWAWWPTDIHIAGVSLVAWLMFIGIFIWFALAVIYVVWVEKIEGKQKNETRG